MIIDASISFSFQVLYEKEGVYIHINVNSHTSDKDAHLPGKVYLIQKVHCCQQLLLSLCLMIIMQ